MYRKVLLFFLLDSMLVSIENNIVAGACLFLFLYQLRCCNGDSVDQYDDDDFFIQIHRMNSFSHGTSRQFLMSDHNKHYWYHNGQTLQLMCTLRNNRNSALQWIDSYGFATDIIVHSDYLRLTLTPDTEDDGLHLACNAKGSQIEKNITIILHANSNISNDYIEPHTSGTIQVKKHEPLYASCDSAVTQGHRIQNGKTLKVLAGNVITENFDEGDNGTTALCVQYRVIDTVKEHGEEIITYQRFKTKYIYYIIEDSVNIVGIVSGTMGAVIILLILIIIMFIVWYRKKHCINNTEEVVYEEIQYLPPKLPPPRRPVELSIPPQSIDEKNVLYITCTSTCDASTNMAAVNQSENDH